MLYRMFNMESGYLCYRGFKEKPTIKNMGEPKERVEFSLGELVMILNDSKPLFHPDDTKDMIGMLNVLNSKGMFWFFIPKHEFEKYFRKQEK